MRCGGWKQGRAVAPGALLGIMLLAGAAQAGAPPLLAPAALEQKLAALPQDPADQLLRRGYHLFIDTPRYAPGYSGNALTCANCHLDAGQRPGASPLWAAWGMYPAWLARRKRFSSFEERVQQCFRYSMNGRPPPLDSPEVHALSAYAQWLAHGQPVGEELPGRGFPAVAAPAAPDPAHGAALYRRRCVACHGSGGAGLKQADGRYAFPPLWGPASYNQGAGMAQPALLARFLKGNMPYGAADLSDQEAADLAAWVDGQDRPADPGP
ncbi:MAG: c-type cytochrome [Nevskia sp.]|nr:c-type cytochrome [Nevskia sp.]